MGIIIKNKVIYSGGGGGGTEEIQPVIYSTEEREVGVWVDGKPLYQKTIDCGALPNNTTKTVLHNIANIDSIVDIRGYSTDGTNFHKFSIVNNAQASLQVVCYANDTNIVFQSGYDYSAWTTTYVTLQYTKTTDTAGSGIWVPSGVPAVHYSEDEQVVGTWIDGKPLYQKSFEYNNLNAVNVDIDVSSLNLKRLVSVEFSSINHDGNMVGDSYYFHDTDQLSCYYRAEAASIRVRRENEHAKSSQGVLTIRYTKTTD